MHFSFVGPNDLRSNTGESSQQQKDTEPNTPTNRQKRTCRCSVMQLLLRRLANMENIIVRFRPRYVRRKRFKRTSDRKLSVRDLAVLDFLWTWKVASTPLLKATAFKGKSNWWVYKALRQLKKERYIQSLPRGKFLDLELWCLTDLGFEVVLMDRDDLLQYRFRPHAPAHDYLATCLQLGEIWQTDDADRSFFTEQMLSSLYSSNFPRSFRKVEEHIPDGLTLFRNGAREALVGYEVDLNLKDEARYVHTLDYYTKGAVPHLVIWLVKNKWVAEKIVQSLKSNLCWRGDDGANFLQKISVVLLDDFKLRVWEAEGIYGQLQGVSIRKLHANLLQSIGKPWPKSVQTSTQEIFFPRYKSPQKLAG